MSIRLMASVWDANLSQSEKLALLALADWANDDGFCTGLRRRQIAQRCCVSERHAVRLIKGLVEAGHLARCSDAVGRAGASYRVMIPLAKGDTHDTLCDRKGDTHVTLSLDPEEIKGDTHVTLSNQKGDMGVTLSDPTILRKNLLKPSSAKKTPTPKGSRPQKPSSPHAWFVAWWCFSFHVVTGSRYAMTKKAAGIIAQLLKGISTEELVERSCVYLTLPGPDRFPRGSPTLEGLAAMINQLAGRCTEKIEDDCYTLGLLPDFETPLLAHRPWEKNENHQLAQN